MLQRLKRCRSLVKTLRDLSTLPEVCTELLIAPCLPSSKIAVGWIVYYYGYKIGTIEPKIAIKSDYFKSGNIAIDKYIFKLDIQIAEALKKLDIPINDVVEEAKVDYLFSILYNVYIPTLKETIEDIQAASFELDEIPF